MSRYQFRAKNWNGKVVKGVLDMGSVKEVVGSIKSSGLVPLAVDLERKTLAGEILKNVTGRVGLKQVAGLTRQLSTMLTAGLVLTDALTLLKNQAGGNSQLFEILDHCLNAVRGGKPLGEALAKYEKVFGQAFVASVKAGEEGGVLEEVFNKLADNLEKDSEFRGKVKGAMIYPVIVVVGMVIVAVVMMAFVVPKLLALYKDFGTSKLPATTLALMKISDVVSRWWFMLPVLAAGGWMALKIGNNNQRFRLKRDEYLLKVPILGPLTDKTILTNTIRTMSMLLAAGIPLVDTLRIVSGVADNEVYAQAFIRISERVQKGFSVANSFEEAAVFPVIVNQMVQTGEATGKLDEVLLKVANYFAVEAEQSVKALTSAIEPLIMIVLGIGVGFLVVAIIMPIYNLTSSL